MALPLAVLRGATAPLNLGVLATNHTRLVMRGVAPVELKLNLDGALVYVDILAGGVFAVPPPNTGAPLASPTPAPVPAAAILVTGVQAFVPGVSRVVFAATSNIVGREGSVVNWTVAALTQCGVAGPGTCGWTWLFQQLYAGSSINFVAPWVLPNATLEVSALGGCLRECVRLCASSPPHPLPHSPPPGDGVCQYSPWAEPGPASCCCHCANAHGRL